ncbi:GNAT family N-acetyltransferase [Clostridium perfringens]
MESFIIDKVSEFYKIESEWKELEIKSKNDNFYNSFDFIKAIIDLKIVNNESLYIIVIKEGKNIIGIAPLKIVEKNIFFKKYKTLEFLAKADYLDFLVQELNHESIIKKIFQVITENEKMWDKIFLSNINEKSHLINYFLKDPNYNNMLNNYAKSPFIDFNCFSNIDNFKKIIPKKANKFSNKLKKEVGYEFEVSVGNDKLIETICNIHMQEQKYLNKKHSTNDRKSLFEKSEHIELLKSLSKKGYVKIFYLKSKNKIISYNICYFYNNILYSWNSAYNTEFEKYRLSKVRYKELFLSLYENNLDYKKFDFGPDGYSWKFEWTDKWNNLYCFKMLNKNSFINKLLIRLRG